MTERREREPFEERLARLARAYTDPATKRAIDPTAMAQGAMARHPRGTRLRRPASAAVAPRATSAGWAAAIVAVALLGVVGAAILGRPSNVVNEPSSSPAASASRLIPEVLRRAWERGMPLSNLESRPPGFLRLTSEPLEYGPVPGADSSRSAVVADGEDRLVATATGESRECALGAVGVYRWSLAGHDTVLTLTSISTDACPAREKALAWDWVRSDLPPRPGELLPPGTYSTFRFDPFARPDAPGQLSYTVPTGWRVEEEQAASMTFHLSSAAVRDRSATDTFIILMAQPRVASAFPFGSSCGPVTMDPAVGPSLDDLVAAISTRHGVASKPRKTITIGGLDGVLLDLRIADDGTVGCRAPDGKMVAVPLLGADPSTGPLVGVATDHPLRLILLDGGGGRSIAVAILSIDPIKPARFDEQVADAMPIVQGLEFHRPTP